MKKEISKKIQDLLANGTPKQKAAIMCKNEEQIDAGDPPLITPEEEQAIKGSFNNNKDIDKYNKWIVIHNKLVQYAKLVLLAYYIYRSDAEELLGYLRIWEDYTREADRLNQLLLFMRKEAPKKVEAFQKEVLSLPYRYGELKLDEDGFFYIDINGENQLYDIIQAKAYICKESLSYVKTYVEIGDKFIKEKKAEAFIPFTYGDVAPQTKADLAASIAPAYSKTALLRKKAEGVNVTPDEEKRAVYPDYNSTPMNEAIREVALERLYN